MVKVKEINISCVYKCFRKAGLEISPDSSNYLHIENGERNCRQSNTKTRGEKESYALGIVTGNLN